MVGALWSTEPDRIRRTRTELSWHRTSHELGSNRHEGGRRSSQNESDAAPR